MGITTGRTKAGIGFAMAAAALFATPDVQADVDLSGTWMVVYHEDWPESGPGSDIGDYAGLPINESARRRAMAWHPSLPEVPERQCMQLPLEFTNIWSNMRLSREFNSDTQKLVAYHLRKELHAGPRVIWMDGRPHPGKHAPHSYVGFSTGEWDGEKLKITTTHLKEGYLKRNGLPRSDRATVIEHFIRHGNNLTISTITDDPIYMTEPRVRTTGYQLSLTRNLNPYPCEPVTELVSLEGGKIPSYYPWKNPYLRQFADKYGVPLDVALGGAEYMYPQFSEKRR